MNNILFSSAQLLCNDHLTDSHCALSFSFLASKITLDNLIIINMKWLFQQKETKHQTWAWYTISQSSGYSRCSLHIFDYTTIQRMTIPRLTKWRPDFDILMIQRLFFFWKKGQNFFPTPHGFHLKTFPTPHGCQKGLKLPLTGFFYPWRELIFSLKKHFLTPNLLQIGKNGLNWPSFFYVT